jgi:hypothetical protein
LNLFLLFKKNSLGGRSYAKNIKNKYKYKTFIIKK